MPAPKPGPACVYCRRNPIDPKWRPFCSERCKLMDLANWADGRYAIPAPDGEDDSQKEDS